MCQPFFGGFSGFHSMKKKRKENLYSQIRTKCRKTLQERQYRIHIFPVLLACHEEMSVSLLLSQACLNFNLAFGSCIIRSSSKMFRARLRRDVTTAEPQKYLGQSWVYQQKIMDGDVSNYVATFNRFCSPPDIPAFLYLYISDRVSQHFFRPKP
eukprot:GHVP01060084.1.p1 GENE.GHVP01060084.1~~GHVP01060084.1.p1  ORF type:complete len:154 (-),score=6.04 GHVP01060084.1:1163-1624(-)